MRKEKDDAKKKTTISMIITKHTQKKQKTNLAT